MRILVFGAGARVEALTRRLLADAGVEAVWRFPANSSSWGQATGLPPTASLDELAQWAGQTGIDLAIPVSEQPIFAGAHATFAQAGVALFGPTTEAAQLEKSKAFSKDLMNRAGIPTPEHIVVDDLAAAETALDGWGEFPVVIKQDVQTAGPNVFVAHSRTKATQALATIETYAGTMPKLIVECYVPGPEYTVWAITDGIDFQLFPRVREYKRAFDGDTGPNTGGMGATAPWHPDGLENHQDFDADVVARILSSMADQQRPFRGLLVVNVLLGTIGPQVLEFNCHWGDPETQTLLSILNGNLGRLLYAAATTSLADAQPLNWSGKHATWITLAEPEYPQRSDWPWPSSLAAAGLDSKMLCYDIPEASPSKPRKTFRLATVGAAGPTPDKAQRAAYSAVESCLAELNRPLHYRRDL